MDGVLFGVKVRCQYHALESLPVADLVNSPLVDPGSFDFHSPSSTEDLSLRGAAVSRDWGMLLIVGLAPCRLDVSLHLCFKRFSEHLPDSVASDPVEAEHELFVGSLVLV